MNSDQINEIATALSKAQRHFKGATKQSENPFFKSKYADLSSVWEACSEALSNNGLSVTQITMISEGHWVLLTKLMHSSGQWIEGEYPINPMKPDPQSFGSAVTYARRYALAAIVGVYAVEDDDHEGGMDRKTQPPKPPIFKSTGLSSVASVIQHPAKDVSPKGSVSDPGDYIFTYGVAKGLKMRNVPRPEIDNYCRRIRETAEEKGVDITGEARVLMDMATKYLGAKNDSQLQELTSDGVPF